MNFQTEKWVIAIFSVFGAFFLCGIGGAVVAEVIGLWWLPVAGFAAAFGAVSLAYLSAPSHKNVFVLAVTIIGSILSFIILKESTYPETYTTKAYTHAFLPLVATLVGGILALTISLYPLKNKT